MKKLLIFLTILGLAIIYISCGGSGDPSSSGMTKVTINLGERQAISKEKSGIFKETAIIPSEVVSIRFTISAPDMVTIQKIIDVAGRTTITETFEIPNGQNRHILVEALDARGNVIYRGETTISLTGSAVTVHIILESTAPPVIEYVDLEPGQVIISDDRLSMSFQITNHGNQAAQNVIAYVIYGDDYSYHCWPFTFQQIPANSSVQENLYPDYYIYYYKIIVDPENAVFETNEDNNVTCAWGGDQQFCAAPPPTSCP
ncbi:MAG: CARDB domain-containing protein [Thermodesulfobacteriota bacterium]